MLTKYSSLWLSVPRENCLVKSDEGGVCVGCGGGGACLHPHKHARMHTHATLDRESDVRDRRTSSCLHPEAPGADKLQRTRHRAASRWLECVSHETEGGGGGGGGGGWLRGARLHPRCDNAGPQFISQGLFSFVDETDAETDARHPAGW